MAIRGRLCRAHVSGWVLQSCLQCFLRPRHATFNCTKAHMAYYSMQEDRDLSPALSHSFALFADILSLADLFSFAFVHLFSCLSSSLSFCNMPLGSFSFLTCVCVLLLCDVSLKKPKLLFLSVSLFSCRFVTHQTFNHSHSVCASWWIIVSAVCVLKLICFHFYSNSFSHHDLQSQAEISMPRLACLECNVVCFCACGRCINCSKVCWCLTLPWQ